MPKKPTDTLDGIRVELNEKERELLGSIATSYRIQSLIPNAVALLKDPVALYALGVIYEWVTGKDAPFILSGWNDLLDSDIAKDWNNLLSKLRFSKQNNNDAPGSYNPEGFQPFQAGDIASIISYIETSLQGDFSGAQV